MIKYKSRHGFFLTAMLLVGKVYSQCPSVITITAPFANLTVTEQAENNILASNTISSRNVTYTAGHHIMLIPGFEVKPGAVFEGLIEECVESEVLNNSLTLRAYPNPFEQNTVIEYSVSERCKANLKILRLNGTEAGSIFIDQAVSKGSHRIIFESQTLAAGVYLCTLTTPTGQQVCKLVKL